MKFLLQTFLASLALLTMGVVEAYPATTRNTKKGLAIHTAESCNALTEHATSSWWYSWGPKSGFDDSFCDDPAAAETAARYAGMEFIPMFWSSVPSFDYENNRMVDDEIHFNMEQTEYLLTFNEPELEVQANLSPLQAAEKWADVEAIAAAYNVEIVAPCVTQDKGIDWYEDWKAACNSLYERDCDFDYTCIHLYYQPYTEDTAEKCDSSDHDWACIQSGSDQGPTRAEYKIEEWAANNPGKPIWVTEYACAPWGSSNGCSPQEQIDIMNQLTPILEASPDVHRYAWFGVYGGEGEGNGWEGNGQNENVWTGFDRKGCKDRAWLAAFGTDAGWKIQTKQECIARADANSDCIQPLALSMDNDACYCATSECNLEETWGGMRTWINVGDRDSSALTEIGKLYETFGQAEPTSPPVPYVPPSNPPVPYVPPSNPPVPFVPPSNPPVPYVPPSNPPVPYVPPSNPPVPYVPPSNPPVPYSPPTCFDYSDILPLDPDYKCTKRGLFLDIRKKFFTSRDEPGAEKCPGGLTAEITALTGTTTGAEAHATFAKWCEDHMADWDTPYSRVGPPSVCYDYTEVLRLGPGECSGRSLFLHIRAKFIENRRAEGAEPCDGGLEREIMALTGTLTVDDAHQAFHDMCFNALQDASDEVGSISWGAFKDHGGVDLEDFFDGAGFLNEETGNFQQKLSNFVGGADKFIYIGEDPRRNDHYPTSETSYNGGEAIREYYDKDLSYSFLLAPETSGFTDGSCSSSNAAVCCWHRDRQYFDKNGNCNSNDCANQNPGDNTDLCWTEDASGTIFPYPGDETENDLHCHGLAWAQTDLAPGDINAKAKWNNLFFVSLYDHLYQRGYADSITDHPLIAGKQAMCGCVEDMNPIARADCTEAVPSANFTAFQEEDGGQFRVHHDTGTFQMKFRACQGYDYVDGFTPEDYANYGDEDLSSSNNDLSAFVFRQYLEGKLDESHVNTIENTLIGYRDPSVNEGDEERDIACQAAFAEKYPELEWAERELEES